MSKPRPLFSGLGRNFHRLRWVWWPILAILLTWVAPFPNAEDMHYLGLAAWPEGVLNNLHEYGHIYLVKLLVELVSNPLLAARLYWGSMLALTVYLTTRVAADLNLPNSRAAGVAALLFLFGGFFKIKQAGILFPDLTAAVGMLASVLIYLRLPAQDGRRRTILLVLLGFILVWGVRSSSANWILVMMLPGLGWRNSQRWQREEFFGGLRRVGAGAILAVTALVLLDGFILGDPWFSLRPLNQLQAAATIYTLPVTGWRGLVFEHFVGGAIWQLAWLWLLRSGLIIWIPLLAATAVVVSRWEHIPPARRLLWLLPWGWLIAPLIARQTIESQWLLPFLVSASTLAASSVIPWVGGKWEDGIQDLFGLLRKWQTYLLLLLLFLYFGTETGWNRDEFAWANYRFFAIALLIGVAAFNLRGVSRWALAGFLGLVLLSGPTAIDGFMRIAMDRYGTNSRQGYALLQRLDPKPLCDSDEPILLSRSLFSEQNLLLNNSRQSAQTLSLGMGCAIDSQRITIVGQTELQDEILSANYASVMLSDRELNLLLAGGAKDLLEDTYLQFRPIVGVVHLIRKEMP